MISFSHFFVFAIWSLFGLQHSILARPFFKSLIKKIFGDKFQIYLYPLIYFISQCIVFLMAYDLIRNIQPSYIYFSTSEVYDQTIYLLNRLSNIFLILTVFHFDVSTFTGFSQFSKLFFKRNNIKKIYSQEINTTFLYKYIRHPMYLGILLVYITSTTIYSDLYFVNLFSIILYIDVGSYFEEKSLIRKFGGQYIKYQSKTFKYFPLIR